MPCISQLHVLPALRKQMKNGTPFAAKSWWIHLGPVVQTSQVRVSQITKGKDFSIVHPMEIDNPLVPMVGQLPVSIHSASKEAYGFDDEISQHGGCGCGPCHEEESLPADLWMPEEGLHVCFQVGPS